jgi:hypothetical protein
MPTRRAVVVGTIATGIAERTGRALGKASQPATQVNFDVPHRGMRLPHAHFR